MNFNDSGTKILLIVVVLFTGLLVTWAVLGGAQPTPPAPVDSTEIALGEGPRIGSADAPVTIFEWADFQCPACKQYEMNVMPQILKEYVVTGKVQLVFKDFQFLGNDSIDAALYSRAVWKLYPEKYLEWRNAMYVAQDEEKDIGFGDAASIDELNATIVGIDAAKLTADVKENKNTYLTQIQADRAEGARIGVNSTPSFVIGSALIAGSQPFSTFQAAIDALLQ